MTLTAVMTIAAGVLSAVVLLGAAVTAATKLWQFKLFRWLLTPVSWTFVTLWLAFDARRDERFAQKVDEAIGRLFLPNGGASLRDLADRLTEIERALKITNKHTDPPEGPIENPQLPDRQPKEH